jgi:hypothetical protein
MAMLWIRAPSPFKEDALSRQNQILMKFLDCFFDAFFLSWMFLNEEEKSQRLKVAMCALMLFNRNGKPESISRTGQKGTRDLY